MPLGPDGRPMGTGMRLMAGRERHEFRPDWTLRPGELLAEMLIDRQLGPHRAAGLCGLTEEIIEDLVHGRRTVNEPIAEGLAIGLGPSARFWLDAQKQYEADLARGAKDARGDYREDVVMGEMDAAARAAGYEVEARVLLTHGADALLELPGEGEAARWPAAEVAAGLGVGVDELPGKRLLATVRESAESGRVLSGFRPAQ